MSAASSRHQELLLDEDLFAYATSLLHETGAISEDLFSPEFAHDLLDTTTTDTMPRIASDPQSPRYHSEAETEIADDVFYDPAAANISSDMRLSSSIHEKSAYSSLITMPTILRPTRDLNANKVSACRSARSSPSLSRTHSEADDYDDDDNESDKHRTVSASSVPSTPNIKYRGRRKKISSQSQHCDVDDDAKATSASKSYAELSDLIVKYLMEADPIRGLSVSELEEKKGSMSLRRRYYDIINILEAVGMVVRFSARYLWRGRENVSNTIAWLKGKMVLSAESAETFVALPTRKAESRIFTAVRQLMVVFIHHEEGLVVSHDELLEKVQKKMEQCKITLSKAAILVLFSEMIKGLKHLNIITAVPFEASKAPNGPKDVIPDKPSRRDVAYRWEGGPIADMSPYIPDKASSTGTPSAAPSRAATPTRVPLRLPAPGAVASEPPYSSPLRQTFSAAMHKPLVMPAFRSYESLLMDQDGKQRDNNEQPKSYTSSSF